MCNELVAVGAKIDGVYYCPHEQDPPCICRKPEPGMLFAAAREHHVDVGSSWMIGDSEKDVEAGRRAGCRTARILRPNVSADGKADVIAQSLLEAVQGILRMKEISIDPAVDNATSGVRCR
jgi:histidinol phosphatase-like enzyme